MANDPAPCDVVETAATMGDMTRIHRTFEGEWAECSDAACDLPFHVDNLSLTEAQATPLAIMLPLFEAVDPPTAVDEMGIKLWYKPESLFGEPIFHRDYGLPAIIYPNGYMEWWQHGQPVKS